MLKLLRGWRGLALLALLAIPLRLTEMGRGLWMDEAWVLNSVQQPTWKEMFWYRTWDQVTPPLALLLWRAQAYILPHDEYIFRIPALIAGVLACLILTWAARQWLREEFALLSGALLALAPLAVSYSKEVKHYSFELLMFSCLAASVAWYSSKPGAARAAILTASLVPAILFGYMVVFAVPVIMVLFWLFPPLGVKPGEKRVNGIVWSLLAMTFAGATAFWVRSVYFAGKHTSEIETFWHRGFPASRGIIDIVRFVPSAVIKVASRIFAVTDGPRLVTGLLVSGALIYGIAAAWRAWRTGQYRRLIFWLTILLPWAGLTAGSVLRLYPLAAGRLTLFLAVPSILAVAATLEGIAAFWSARSGGRIALPKASAIVAGATLAAYALFIAFIGSDGQRPYWRDGMRGYVSEMRTRSRPDDAVYASRSVYEVVKFYVDRDGTIPGRLLLQEKLIPESPFARYPDVKRWSMLFFDDEIYWQENSLIDEPAMCRAEAKAHGCQIEEQHQRWSTAELFQIDCNR